MSATPLQLDDNLRNGQTYTFQFEDDNFFTSGLSTLQNDLVVNAPDFLGSLQLSPVALGLTKSYMNVQFTYEGDGSDVVSDVANSMMSAFLTGSNDSFGFSAAYGQPAAYVPPTPEAQAIPTVASTASAAVQVVTDTANQVAAGAGQVTNTATSAVFSAALPWLIGAVLIVIVVLPVIAKSGLVPKVRVA